MMCREDEEQEEVGNLKAWTMQKEIGQTYRRDTMANK